MTTSRRSFSPLSCRAFRSAHGQFASQKAIAASDTVAIASLHDLSGPIDVNGMPSHMCNNK